MEDDNEQRYDAVAITIADSKILWVYESTTLDNAEAACSMAVMRQGVDDRFFAPVRHGQYKAGDKYTGNDLADAK